MPEFSSYQELLDYYHKFLKREVKSPHDELMEESDVIVSQLLAINRAGILSFSSQPGSQIVMDRGEYKQRAYLSCYMKLKLAQKLQEKYINNPRIILYIEGLATLKEKPLASIPVSIETTDEELYYEYIDEEGDVCTSIPIGFNFPDLETMLSNTSTEKRMIIAKDLVQVHFIDFEWCEESYLFDSVAEWAAKCAKE